MTDAPMIEDAPARRAGAAGWAPFIPPYTPPWPALPSLVRAMLRGDGALLSLLPAEAYRMKIGPLGYSRRSIVVVNEPAMVLSLIHI